MEVMLGKIVQILVRWFGVSFRDAATDEKIGKGFIIGFGSKIYVVGYHGKLFFPDFVPEKKTGYAWHRIGFFQHPPPDFRNVKNS
jgi:hypothetical protein